MKKKGFRTHVTTKAQELVCLTLVVVAPISVSVQWTKQRVSLIRRGELLFLKKMLNSVC